MLARSARHTLPHVAPSRKRRAAVKSWHIIGKLILRVCQVIRLRDATIEYCAAYCAPTVEDETVPDDSDYDSEPAAITSWVACGTIGIIRQAASSFIWFNLEVIALPVLRQALTVIGFQLCKRLLPFLLQTLALLALAKWLRPETVKLIATLVTDE